MFKGEDLDWTEGKVRLELKFIQAVLRVVVMVSHQEINVCNIPQ